MITETNGAPAWPPLPIPRSPFCVGAAVSGTPAPSSAWLNSTRPAKPRAGPLRVGRALYLAFALLLASPAYAQPRCDPSLRVDHTQQFREIVSLLQLSRDAESFAKLKEYRVAMGNMAGAMQVKCEGATPPPPAAPPSGGEKLVYGGGGANTRIEIPVFGSAPAVFRVDIPADASATVPGYVTIVTRGDEFLREITVSTTPGDFTNYIARGRGVQASVIWAVPPTAGDANLTPGRTYYINVRNIDSGTANRPAMVEIRWPQ